MCYRLIALDLDGTLLTSDHTITPRAEAAIRTLTSQGVTVVLCTGRPPRMTRPYAVQLDLAERAICHHGALTYDFVRDTARHRTELAADEALAVIDGLYRMYPEALLSLETLTGFYYDRALYALKRHSSEPDGVGDVRAFVDGPVTKVLARHPQVDAPELARALAERPVHCTWSSPRLMEVVAVGVNKATALKRVAAELGLSRAQVAAFGDQHNDKEMLTWAGRGVAMANGSETVKAIADEVTTSNDEDGVARILERWL